MNLIPKNLSQLRRIALSVLLASFAILDTTSISAQEPGRTITSPFGVANPYMNASDASESGSDEDTFVDPETGEVGHIIRNPFGVANPNDVDTGIDIPDDAGEEVGGIITSPFGVPASDDIDTGVDVLDEDEEYLISLPDDEESEVEDAEDVEEGDDETSDDVKELEEESAKTATEKYIPVIDNPIRGGEYPSFDFKLETSAGGMTVSNETGSNTPVLYVSAGEPIHMQAILTNGSWPSGSPTWTLSPDPRNQPLTQGVSDISLPTNANGMSDLPLIPVPARMNFRRYTITAFAGNESRSIQIVIARVDLQIDSNNDGSISEEDDIVENSNNNNIDYLGKIIIVNDGDLDQDGIPDCYDGFDIDFEEANQESQAGNMKSEAFTPIKIDLSDLQDLISDGQNVSISLTYTAANPQYENICGTGTVDNPYAFSDSRKGLRIWTKDGTSQRNKKSFADSGDYIPTGVYISIDKYDNAQLINIDKTIPLFVEAKTEPANHSPVTITCNVRIGNKTFSDSVKVSSLKSFIKAIDISGYAKNLNINRIPINEEVDGIVADRLNGVDDGAALLLCFAVPQKLVNRISPETINFCVRHCNGTGQISNFFLSESDGTYIYDIPSDNTVLSSLQVEEALPVPDGRKVIKRVIYLPPVEMDSTASSTDFFRNIDLVAKANVISDTNGNSNGSVELYSHKRLIITRPPLLMVHGINGTSESVFNDDELPLINSNNIPFMPHFSIFSSFKKAMNNAGIMTYGVDHNNELSHTTDPDEYPNHLDYKGNGDIVVSYQFLRDKIYSSDNNSVLKMYRNGNLGAINNKKIAIQKVDVVGYSYGGLLARWYVEKAPEYETRRDVRKIITIGTPHRGSSITNMMCESYKKPLFANANSGCAAVGSISIAHLLDNFIVDDLIKWYKGNDEPGSSDADDFDLYEALHVIAHNSLRLQELNNSTEPLCRDVAYASIVGTSEKLLYLSSSWKLCNPNYDFLSDKSYYPWADGIETHSDGIVPQDSQMLVAKSDINFISPSELDEKYENIVHFVSETHLGEVGSGDTQNKVILWLNNPNLYLGSTLSNAFGSLTTRYNLDRTYMYSQQKYIPNPSNCLELLYSSTGVNPDAIVQTVLTMPAGNPTYTSGGNVLGPHGGIVTVKCTGMVPDNTRTLTIVADEADDKYLHGPLNIADPSGVTSYPLKPFSVTGTIGRMFSDDVIRICGPDGSATALNTVFNPPNSWDIGYEMTGDEYYGFCLQSPPTRMNLSTNPVLDPLVKEETSSQPPSQPPFQISGPTNFIARGGFLVTADGVTGHSQRVKVEVYDKNDNATDILLEEGSVDVSLDPKVFAGILMPYEINSSSLDPIELTKNGSGHISGSKGSNGKSTAHVYQKLIIPSGLPANKSKSATIEITTF